MLHRILISEMSPFLGMVLGFGVLFCFSLYFSGM